MIESDAGIFQADLTQYLPPEPPYTVPDGKERVKARLFKRVENDLNVDFTNNVSYTREPKTAQKNWVFDTSGLDFQTVEKRQWYDRANERSLKERGKIIYEIKEIPSDPNMPELVLLDHSHPYGRNNATTYCLYLPDRDPQLHVLVLPIDELITSKLGIELHTPFNVLEGVH